MALDQLLKSHPFTEGMTDAAIKKLVPLARLVSFEEDEIVFRAGERSMYFCLLLAGSACVELRTPCYSITIQTLGPGDAFGWSSLLEEHHLVFQVRAREPSSALFLDGAQLTAACRKDPRLAAIVYYRLAQVVAKRVKATEVRLTEFCGSANPTAPSPRQGQASARP